MIVDSHVNVFPSPVTQVLASLSMDAMADTPETAQFLDVQMEQVARARVFVAARWRERLQISKSADSFALQDAAYRGRTESAATSNAAARPAQATQRLHLFDQQRRSRPAEAVRARTVVVQPRSTLLALTTHPHRSGARADVEGGCSRLQRHSWSQSHFRQRLSTVQRKSGILVNVHSISPEASIARHNQHLRFWSNGQPVERSQLDS
jgi:hypothetical protein